jgi:replicative DNA helicase
MSQEGDGIFDPERAFTSKMISEGAIAKAIARGIKADHFKDLECGPVFETTVVHFRKHREPPSKDVIRAKHPGFTFDPAPDAFSWYLDEFVREISRRAAIDTQRRVAAAIADPSQRDNLDVVMVEAGRMMSQLVPSSAVARFSEMESRIAEYERKEREGVNPGIFTGFKTIDDLTFGFQPHENIVILAPSGCGKSTLTQKLLFEAYVQGKTALFVSLEMGADQLMRNWDAMAANLSRRAVKMMGLGGKEIEKWRQEAIKADEAKAERDIIVMDDVAGCTPDKIWAETYRHEPDIVAVDYIDLLDAPKGMVGWQAVAYNARQLKMNARISGIPHIVVAQTNRDGFSQGARKDNVGGSIGITQNCDIGIGLWGGPEDEHWQDQNMLEINLWKNRDGKGHPGFKVHADLDKMEIGERVAAHSFIQAPEKGPDLGIFG